MEVRAMVIYAKVCNLSFMLFLSCSSNISTFHSLPFKYKMRAWIAINVWKSRGLLNKKLSSQILYEQFVAYLFHIHTRSQSWKKYMKMKNLFKKNPLDVHFSSDSFQNQRLISFICVLKFIQNIHRNASVMKWILCKNYHKHEMKPCENEKNQRQIWIHIAIFVHQCPRREFSPIAIIYKMHTFLVILSVKWMKKNRNFVQYWIILHMCATIFIHSSLSFVVVFVPTKFRILLKNQCMKSLHM